MDLPIQPRLPVRPARPPSCLATPDQRAWKLKTEWPRLTKRYSVQAQTTFLEAAGELRKAIVYKSRGELFLWTEFQSWVGMIGLLFEGCFVIFHRQKVQNQTFCTLYTTKLVNIKVRKPSIVTLKSTFSNFSCMFLNPNIFFQLEF